MRIFAPPSARRTPLSPTGSMSQYLRFSRSSYYAVIAALPLLMAYELLLLAVGGTGTSQVRNAAEVWVRNVLTSFDITHRGATATMILVLVVAIPLVRQREITLTPRYFGYILLESVCYGLALRFLINFILVVIFSLFTGAPPVAMPDAAWHQGLAAALPAGTGFWSAVALSLGAGLFEEFFFRVILLSALLALTRVVFARWLSAVISVVAAAGLFSLAHYVGPLGDPLELHSFMFRWVAGLIFTVLYHQRGFAVVAYSHAFYDIWLLLW